MKFDEFKEACIAAFGDRPFSPSEARESTGAARSSVANWLKSMVESGTLTAERGVYAFAVAPMAETPKIEVVKAVNDTPPPKKLGKQVSLFPTTFTKCDTGTVGQSEGRTYGKHSLLDKVTGRLAGVFSVNSPKTRFLRPPYFFIDLCAGDGQASYFSAHSSPEILTRHSRAIIQKRGIESAIVILVEKDRATFDKLQKAFPATGNTYLIHGDSKDPSVIAEIGQIIKTRGNASSPCFVHNDPNKVTDWAITAELLNVLPRYTTSLTTMGCNVGGLKRLGLEDREGWFDHVQVLAQTVHSVKCHNAYLASLRNDKSQWAYLVTGPTKWEQDVVSDVQKAFKDWPHGIEGAWLSESDKFNALIKSLFLTKKEVANVA